jgi:DNA-binding transcriptional LysR family regulator
LALFQQRRSLAVSVNHPFAQRGTVRLVELDGQPYIDRMHCELWGETRQLFESKACQPRIVYRADREEWVISLIAAGLGVAIMPEWQDIPAVAYIPIVDLPLHRTVSLSWRMGYESDVIEKFCTFAASHDW